MCDGKGENDKTKNAMRECGRGVWTGGRAGAVSLPEDTDAFELLLEPGHAAAAIHDLLGAAGPGRMRFGVDVEVQLVAFLAPGGTGLILGPVGHHDRNHMIIRMNFGFHGCSSGAPAPVSYLGNCGFGRLYNPCLPPKQAAERAFGTGAVPDLPEPPSRAYLRGAIRSGLDERSGTA